MLLKKLALTFVAIVDGAGQFLNHSKGIQLKDHVSICLHGVANMFSLILFKIISPVVCFGYFLSFFIYCN